MSPQYQYQDDDNGLRAPCIEGVGDTNTNTSTNTNTNTNGQNDDDADDDGGGLGAPCIEGVGDGFPNDLEGEESQVTPTPPLYHHDGDGNSDKN